MYISFSIKICFTTTIIVIKIFVAEGDRLWEMCIKACDDLSLEDISRSYTVYHKIVNAIYIQKKGMCLSYKQMIYILEPENIMFHTTDITISVRMRLDVTKK